MSDNRRVGLENILHEVKKREESAKEYFAYAKNVHENYIDFINKYNSCLFKFREIHQNFSNYKTLFLLTNERLRNEVEQIGANFDSALVYFDVYQKSCEKLPHLMSVSAYQLNPITTYRLEGLVESDFTNEEVMLWDYKSWSDNFLRILDADIDQIRKGLIAVDGELTNQIAEFKNEITYSDEHETYKVDDKFQNLISMYERTSVCNEILDYKKAKLDFLMNIKSEINDPADTSDFFLINKLRFYNKLANKLDVLNSMADKMKREISIDDIGKYFDFFASNYNGLDGFKRWCEIEKYDNYQIFDDNLDNLLTFIDKDRLRYPFKGQYFTHKNRQIPFGVSSRNDSLADPLISVDQMLVSGNNTYLLGKENDGGLNRPFFVKLNAKSQVEWMKTIVNPENNSSDLHLKIPAKLLDNGNLMVAGMFEDINSESGFQWKTCLTRIDSKGHVLKFHVFDHLGHPLHLYIDEIAEQYLLIGIKLKKDFYDMDELIVGLYNFNDSLLWERHLPWIGELVDVIVSNSDFFLVSNFMYLKVNEKEFSGSGNNILAAIFIDRAGSQLQVNQYKTNSFAEIKNAYKITNSVINFTGRIKPPGADSQSYKPAYILINDRGELVFSNNKTIEYEFWRENN